LSHTSLRFQEINQHLIFFKNKLKKINSYHKFNSIEFVHLKPSNAEPPLTYFLFNFDFSLKFCVFFCIGVCVLILTFLFFNHFHFFQNQLSNLAFSPSSTPPSSHFHFYMCVYPLFNTMPVLLDTHPKAQTTDKISSCSP